MHNLAFPDLPLLHLFLSSSIRSRASSTPARRSSPTSTFQLYTFPPLADQHSCSIPSKYLGHNYSTKSKHRQEHSRRFECFLSLESRPLIG
ncbi:hypothetical protein DL98DRAFT_46184 [Cadophora sp. DSE1049]|nr:hypothetical protein DL98DRAFT_46184 [Cadophora sp. DSE1049]